LIESIYLWFFTLVVSSNNYIIKAKKLEKVSGVNSMPENDCALCGIAIDDNNNTKEHIIPNAIGGRKKIKGFICKDCNNRSGEEWEKELAAQLNPLSLFFHVQRERGDAPAQRFETVNSKDTYLLKYDGTLQLGKPKYNEVVHEDRVEISISAPSVPDAKKMLKGVSRKYSQVNPDEIIEKIESKPSYLDDYLHFELKIGGHQAGRSIVKSALAMVKDAGINVKICEHALEYLDGDDTKACFGYYNETDPIVNRPEGVPLHCVYVKGDPSSNLIFGYIEFFGLYRIVVGLSSSYAGEAFENSYVLDPTTGKVLDLSFKLDLSKSDIVEIYDYKKVDFSKVQDAANKVIQRGMQINDEMEISRLVDKAWEKFSLEVGDGEGNISKEDNNNFLPYLYESLTPFFLHKLTGVQLGRSAQTDDEDI